jgi:hypothetical protein
MAMEAVVAVIVAVVVLDPMNTQKAIRQTRGKTLYIPKLHSREGEQ